MKLHPLNSSDYLKSTEKPPRNATKNANEHALYVHLAELCKQKGDLAHEIILSLIELRKQKGDMSLIIITLTPCIDFISGRRAAANARTTSASTGDIVLSLTFLWFHTFWQHPLILSALGESGKNSKSNKTLQKVWLLRFFFLIPIIESNSPMNILVKTLCFHAI